MNKKMFLLVILLIALIFVIAFSSNEEESIYDETLYYEGTIDKISYEVTEDITNYIQLVINDENVVLIELYPDDAPITVSNFQSLVLEGYYDGLEFHRVIEDFMIQGGSGEDVDSIVGEFTDNGYDNTISHTTGTLSMARSSDYDSASSQFFICLNETGCTHLDGSYAAFGKVIAGMDSILEVSYVETDSSDAPVDIQIISSINFVNIEE